MNVLLLFLWSFLTLKYLLNNWRAWAYQIECFFLHTANINKQVRIPSCDYNNFTQNSNSPFSYRGLAKNALHFTFIKHFTFTVSAYVLYDEWRMPTHCSNISMNNVVHICISSLLLTKLLFDNKYNIANWVRS